MDLQCLIEQDTGLGRASIVSQAPQRRRTHVPHSVAAPRESNGPLPAADPRHGHAAPGAGGARGEVVPEQDDTPAAFRRLMDGHESSLCPVIAIELDAAVGQGACRSIRWAGWLVPARTEMPAAPVPGPWYREISGTAWPAGGVADAACEWSRSISVRGGGEREVAIR